MSEPSRDEAIPALVNPSSGSADEAIEALRADRRFTVREVEPDRIADVVRELVGAGTRRILVSGGDGTIAAAADALAATGVELAVLPGGTLNHFAKAMGIPTEHRQALDVAAAGRRTMADLGRVNGRVILNTSSVGAYVTFVRVREKLEQRLGYWLASIIASLRILWRLRAFRLELEAEGKERDYSTPLVFIGIGERELRLPNLGDRRPGGARGLHVVVVRGAARARLAALAWAAAARGLHATSRTPHMDGFLVERCTIELPAGRFTIAVDGELVEVESPLAFQLERDAIAVVVPASDQSLPTLAAAR